MQQEGYNALIVSTRPITIQSVIYYCMKLNFKLFETLRNALTPTSLLSEADKTSLKRNIFQNVRTFFVDYCFKFREKNVFKSVTAKHI